MAMLDISGSVMLETAINNAKQPNDPSSATAPSGEVDRKEDK